MLRHHFFVIFFCIAVLAPSSVNGFGFFSESWTWFTYHFMWSNKFTFFDDHVCQLDPLTSHTFHFGGSRSKGKLSWVVGSSVWNWWSKQGLHDMEGMVDENGKVHNAGKVRLPREKLMPLMIGSDYFEPCKWRDQVPKIMSYKVSAPTTVKLARGEFDMFVGKGFEECGQGRLGYLGSLHGLTEDEKKAWVDKASNYEFNWDPNPDRKQPLATFNSGGIFSGTAADREQADGRYFTSSLFDPGITEQTICLIFYCYNKEMDCAVSIEQWQVSDIAGLAYESVEGTAFWNMTPMDMFAFAMTIFCPIFFCIQCCCCCQVCAHELRGGSVDQQAILEQQVRDARAGNARRQPSPRRSPRHAQYNTSRRSPRRAR